MAAKKLFFSLCAYQPHFKAKMFLNFALAKEASEDDWHKDKRIITSRPFMSTVYLEKSAHA